MLSIVYIFLTVLNVYSMVIFVYILLSWFPVKKGLVADINNFLRKICDPYLNLFRKLVPPIGGMVDITPIIALLVLQLVGRLVVFIF
ncbi:MAG: YggT family protein [Eggerthellaceae bacterium]|nr:YggT family protein [Eggerthellaceae bacterium]